MSFEIYTDGSCIGNPGPGGWAFIVIDKNAKDDDGSTSGVVHHESGYDKATTNNRMEMMAIIKALEYGVKKKWDKIKIHSDSNLLVSTINLGWKKKANLDLWLEMEKLLSKIKIDISWVKAHDKNIYNNMVDELAFNAASKK
ncbi:MAG: ribonuclease H [Candidatus Peregrinibacteria bacterium]|nr:ribonuclease H [Candidatus Peregrinibacteria bacterium]MDZ4244568.1 ribonuclease H [Candidatus Gracilibacteria bacterium]